MWFEWKNKVVVIFAFVFVIAGGVYFLGNNKAQKFHSIELRENGFTPSEVTISLGETVTFTNKTDKPFWPASDLHPTHGIYPDFDPGEPVQAGQSWSFKFTKSGTWNFHDHLNPLYIGVVTVGNVQKISCKLGDKSIECWQELLNETLDKDGLPATFDLIADLYVKEPLFASECHSFVHEIGKFAFKKFSSEEGFELNSKTSYCGYGFYHGFMETLLQATGDVNKAEEFCKYVGKKLAGETTDGEGACYHGIGHGAVDGSDERSWGDPQAMIDPGLRLCVLVSKGDNSKYGKLYRCVTGAYNSIEILSHDPRYKLGKFEKDPFSLCLTQKEEYKEGCYTNMLPAILILTNNDLLKSQKYIDGINENSYEIRKPVTSGLWVEFIRMNLTNINQDITNGINMCRQVVEPLQLSCFYGLAEGFMKYGDPKDAYSKGLSFCARGELKEKERDMCYNSILTRLRVWYSVDKSREICQSMPISYQKYCKQ